MSSLQRTLLALIAVIVTSATGCDVNPKTESDFATFRRSISSDPETLDPHKFRSNQAAQVIRDLGEGLLSYSPEGKLIPGVAAHWIISEDGLRYTFSIRPNARWSNGRNVSAYDFEYSFRRLLDPQTASPSANLLHIISNAKEIISGEAPTTSLGVTAVDNSTLSVELTAPAPYFLQILTHPSTFPLYRPAIERFGSSWTAPKNMVLNGAYRLENRTTGSSITLSRNPFYWDNGNTWFEKVLYRTLDPRAELLQYRAGELDFTGNLDSSNFHLLRQTRPSEVKISPALAIYYFGFNLTRPPFLDNSKLREALSLALNREAIVESVTGRGELAAYSIVPPGMQNYTPPQLVVAKMSRQEREKEARLAYQEAGYGPQNPVTFELRYNTLGDHEKIAVAAQSMWKEVLGAEAKLVREEFKVFIENIREMRETELYRLSWVGEYLDPHTFLQLFQTGNPNNLTAYSDSDFDKALQLASKEADRRRRESLLNRAERIVLSDHAIIPLYFYVNKHLVAPDIVGYTPNLFDVHYSKSYRRQVMPAGLN